MLNKKFASILAASSLLLTACTGGGSTDTADTAAAGGDGEIAGEITFQTWALKNDKFTPYFEEAIAEFEEEYPEVTVNWMDQPGDGYEDKLLQQAESGDLPDVINLPEGMAYNLAKVNLLADLSDAGIEDYVDGAVEAYQYDGIDGSFGLPWYLGTDLEWYNTKDLDKAGVDSEKLPTTTDEFFDMANEVAKNTNGEVKLVSDLPRGGVMSIAGVKLADEDGTFIFNSPEAVALVEKYKEAYDNGAMVPEALNADYQGNAELYKQGRTGHTTGSSGFVGQLESDAPTLLDSSVPTTRLGTPPLYIQGISVAADSEAPEAALEFAKFITSNDKQVEFVELAQGFFPGTKEANENPDSFTDVIESDLQVKATELAAEALDKAVPEKPIHFTDDMDIYLAQQVALAIRGDIGIQEALDKAVDYANQNAQL